MFYDHQVVGFPEQFLNASRGHVLFCVCQTRLLLLLLLLISADGALYVRERGNSGVCVGVERVYEKETEAERDGQKDLV